MNSLTKETMFKLFEDIFNEKPDTKRIDNLIETFGSLNVSNILVYLSCRGIFPPAQGIKSNPYGLIFRMCKENREKV